MKIHEVDTKFPNRKLIQKSFICIQGFTLMGRQRISVEPPDFRPKTINVREKWENWTTEIERGTEMKWKVICRLPEWQQIFMKILFKFCVLCHCVIFYSLANKYFIKIYHPASNFHTIIFIQIQISLILSACGLFDSHQSSLVDDYEKQKNSFFGISSANWTHEMYSEN